MNQEENMSSGITLKIGRLSQVFRDSLKDYYLSIGVDGRYPELKWRQWIKEKRIILYVAERDMVTVGWVVFNPAHSTIEELLVKNEEAVRGLEDLMADALIAKEMMAILSRRRSNDLHGPMYR